LRKEKNSVTRIDEVIETGTKLKAKDLHLVVDRIVSNPDDEDFANRLADAVQVAFYEGKGTLSIESLSTSTQRVFSNAFELDGISFLEPNTHLFSFNNVYFLGEEKV